MELLKIAMMAGIGATILTSPVGAQGGNPGDGPVSTRSSNIVPSDTKSTIAPSLPASPAGDDAAIRDYLRAARESLTAGRTGEAQQSLEMAETRALTRVVPAEEAAMPAGSSLISRIKNARMALGHGDRSQAIALIDMALAG